MLDASMDKLLANADTFEELNLTFDAKMILFDAEAAMLDVLPIQFGLPEVIFLLEFDDQ